MADRLFSFPNPVNEVAARLVAAGVLALSVVELVTRDRWLLIPIAYGFVARVLTGPKLSPLGRLVTSVVVPRQPLHPRFVPGPPKRFAQGIGATLTTLALVAWLAGALGISDVLVGLLIVAAALESVFALCLGCKLFGVLMRAGVIPDRICLQCAAQGRANDRNTSALPRGSRSRVKQPNCTSNPRCHS